MTVRPQHNPTPAPHAQTSQLLLSAPNAVTSNRIRTHLAAAAIPAEESDLGLRITCADLDHQTILESIGVGLSAAERRDTRVAVVRSDQDPAAFHHSIFRAQSLEDMLGSLRDRWLDDVLDRNAIAIHLQPIVQFPPGRIHGYECLMRGVDPQGNLISPVKMFDAARHLGRSTLLDQLCRTAAIHAAAQLAPTTLTFFINVLPSAMTDPKRQFAQMTQQLDAAGLKPQQITFEIVETDQFPDQRRLLTALQYYRKAGFKLALDDVGAGYSSLLSLSRLRPDYIKLDGELVRRAATSALDAKLIADLAETARQNGIITIAEGIETPEQFRLIYNSGIRLTQGYLHSKPRPLPLTTDETRLLAEHASRATASTQDHAA